MCSVLKYSASHQCEFGGDEMINTGNGEKKKKGKGRGRKHNMMCIRFLLGIQLLLLTRAYLAPPLPLQYEGCPTSASHLSAVDVALDGGRLSAAERVVRASSPAELLAIAEEGQGGGLVLPGQESKHYETQYIHMKKRQATATNALKRLSEYMIGSQSQDLRTSVISSTSSSSCSSSSSSSASSSSSSSKAFSNLVLCALTPLPEMRDDDVVNYAEALRSIGHFAPLLDYNNDNKIQFNQTDLYHLLEALLTDITPLILPRLPITSLTAVIVALEKLFISDKLLSLYTKRLHSSDYHIPFKLRSRLSAGRISLSQVLSEVVFQRDTFTTVKGKQVLERRGTCWMAEEGVGGLAYSGKIMAPVPLSPCIASLRDHLFHELNIYFDCFLVNYYPDGDCAVRRL